MQRQLPVAGPACCRPCSAPRPGLRTAPPSACSGIPARPHRSCQPVPWQEQQAHAPATAAAGRRAGRGRTRSSHRPQRRPCRMREVGAPVSPCRAAMPGAQPTLERARDARAGPSSAAGHQVAEVSAGTQLTWPQIGCVRARGPPLQHTHTYTRERECQRTGTIGCSTSTAPWHAAPQQAQQASRTRRRTPLMPLCQAPPAHRHRWEQPPRCCQTSKHPGCHPLRPPALRPPCRQPPPAPLRQPARPAGRRRRSGRRRAGWVACPEGCCRLRCCHPGSAQRPAVKPGQQGRCVGGRQL